jgi:hypothetical protein
MSSKPWDIVGIEFEYTDIIPLQYKEIERVLNRMGVQVTHDASVESPSEIFKINNKPISGRTLNCVLNKALIKKTTIGGELVSPMIDTETKDWIFHWDELFGLLQQNGERENSNRGSIHVHVNMDRDHTTENRFTIGMLRRLWMLSGFFEAAFFKLGAFGRPHRGAKMDFVYYRPILGTGPPVVRDGNDNYRHLLNFEDVMAARNTLDFFIKCGDIYNADNRYHPCRYMWVNFFNMRANNPHIEFRVFNKTMRWDYLYSVVELCKAFVATAYNRPTEELTTLIKKRVVGVANPPKPKSDARYFKDLIDFLQMDDKFVISKLEKIWQESEYPEYTNDRVYSHLNSRTRCYFQPETMEIAPEVLERKVIAKIRTPQFIDIHALRNMNETIFPETIRA